MAGDQALQVFQQELQSVRERVRARIWAMVREGRGKEGRREGRGREKGFSQAELEFATECSNIASDKLFIVSSWMFAPVRSDNLI